MKTQAETKAKAPATRCGCSHCAAHDAGIRGPFTPAEFMAVVGVVNEPAPPEVSYELALLGAEVDLAAMRYDRASDAWVASTARLQQLKGRLREGDPKLAEADRDVAANAIVRAEMAEALGAARSAYNAKAREESEARRIAEYRATLQAQDDERAARAAAAAAVPTSLVDRIRALVVG